MQWQSQEQSPENQERYTIAKQAETGDTHRSNNELAKSLQNTRLSIQTADNVTRHGCN